MCSPDRHDGSCADCENDVWPTPDLTPTFRPPVPLSRDGGEIPEETR